jgi:4-amino-4-deoxy-L-arabinose transferase-like glycosyltransferase
MVIISTITIYFIYLAGKEYYSKEVGLIAATLVALNITAIANAPMILSDTYFGLFAAIQFYLFVKFLKVKEYKYFYWSIFFASVGVLIRPINLVWVIPATFIMICTKECGTWKKKLLAAIIAFAIYGVVLIPYMGYNASRNLGWCIDTNTGAMVHQNGAMILAEAKGTDFESEKAIIIEENNKEFADKVKYPTRAEQEKFRIKKYRKIVLQHPFIWLKQQFKYQILLPDVPTFFEIFGVTSAGRGTMGVMAKEGLIKAIIYYFDGKIYLPLMLIPFLIVVGITYLGCLGKLVFNLKKIKVYYLEILLFLGFAEYYFFLPGAITAPRYQIPALPVITLLAAIAIINVWKVVKSKVAKKDNN